nr:hypothetical protein Itr_chr12CG06160 [Ipomoea trifida]
MTGSGEMIPFAHCSSDRSDGISCSDIVPGGCSFSGLGIPCTSFVTKICLIVSLSGSSELFPAPSNFNSLAASSQLLLSFFNVCSSSSVSFVRQSLRSPSFWTMLSSPAFSSSWLWTMEISSPETISVASLASMSGRDTRSCFSMDSVSTQEIEFSSVEYPSSFSWF